MSSQLNHKNKEPLRDSYRTLAYLITESTLLFDDPLHTSLEGVLVEAMRAHKAALTVHLNGWAHDDKEFTTYYALLRGILVDNVRNSIHNPKIVIKDANRNQRRLLGLKSYFQDLKQTKNSSPPSDDETMFPNATDELGTS